MTGTDCGSPFV